MKGHHLLNRGVTGHDVNFVNRNIKSFHGRPRCLRLLGQKTRQLLCKVASQEMLVINMNCSVKESEFLDSFFSEYFASSPRPTVGVFLLLVGERA